MNSRKTRKTRKTRVNKLNVRNRTRRRGRGKRHHRGSGVQFSTPVRQEPERRGPERGESFNVTQARREEEEAAAAQEARAVAEAEAAAETRRCPKCRKRADITVRLLNDRNVPPDVQKKIYDDVGFIPEHVIEADENRLIRMYKEMDAAKAAKAAKQQR